MVYNMPSWSTAQRGAGLGGGGGGGGRQQAQQQLGRDQGPYGSAQWGMALAKSSPRTSLFSPATTGNQQQRHMQRQQSPQLQSTFQDSQETCLPPGYQGSIVPEDDSPQPMSQSPIIGGYSQNALPMSQDSSTSRGAAANSSNQPQPSPIFNSKFSRPLPSFKPPPAPIPRAQQPQQQQQQQRSLRAQSPVYENLRNLTSRDSRSPAPRTTAPWAAATVERPKHDVTKIIESMRKAVPTGAAALASEEDIGRVVSVRSLSIPAPLRISTTTARGKTSPSQPRCTPQCALDQLTSVRCAPCRASSKAKTTAWRRA